MRRTYVIHGKMQIRTEKLKRFFLLIMSLSFLMLPRYSYAAPEISNVSGSITHGESITINGLNFGPKGPDIVIFDDFEKGVNGEDIMIGPDSAQVGGWDQIEGTRKPKYDNSNMISGSLAFRADMSEYWRELVTAFLPELTRKVFISRWQLIPEGTFVPGYMTTDSINWKTIWIQGAGTTDDDLTLPTFLQGVTSPESVTFVAAGNHNPYGKYFTLDFEYGRWQRLWLYINGGYDNDGEFYYWELTDSGVMQRVYDQNFTTLYEGGIFERVCLNGYGRSTQNSYPTFDDVYIATGDAAMARVEIGDQPIYEDCTNLAITTPTSWSDNSIATTIRQGSFQDGETAYIFVVDANGSVSENGYLITISANPEDITPPNTPSGLNVN